MFLDSQLEIHVHTFVELYLRAGLLLYKENDDDEDELNAYVLNQVKPKFKGNLAKNRSRMKAQFRPGSFLFALCRCQHAVHLCFSLRSGTQDH